jgi:transposase
MARYTTFRFCLDPTVEQYEMLARHAGASRFAFNQCLSKSLSRKKKESHNRKDVAARLGRHHHHVANVRRHFLHQVSNELVKTHDRLVIEDHAPNAG